MSNDKTQEQFQYLLGHAGFQLLLQEVAVG